MADWSQYTDAELLAGAALAQKAGDTAAMQEMLNNIEARKRPDTERLRAIAQGATLGFSDEIAAAALNPMSAIGAALGTGDQGAAYNERLQAERDALRRYKNEYPMSSAGYEIGGAVLPALLSRGRTAPGSATSILGSGIQAGIAGAKQGGIYGFGTGEGDFLNRAVKAGIGALTGGSIGGLLGTAGGIAQKYGVQDFVNKVRNASGDRMAGVVANEIQRMAEQSGLTADEIIARIASGQLMAENRTLNNYIRKFYAEGGPAGAEIKTTLSARPSETRTAAMSEMQRNLSTSTDPNTLRAYRMAEDAAKAAEGTSFDRILLGGGGAVTNEIQSALEDAFQRVPGVANELSAYTRANTKTMPYFKVKEDGTVEFTRQPTLQEAEIARRFLQRKADEAYRSGSPWGEVYKGIEQSVREPIDAASAELAAARANWANIKGGREAFDIGTKAIAKSPDELAMIYDDIQAKGADAVAAFREGMMTAMRAGMAKPSTAPGLMRNLATEGTGPSTALRLALPPSNTDNVLNLINTANEAQAASGHILGGSSTALTALAPSVGQVANVGEDIMGALSLNPRAILSLVGRIAGRAEPKLTDAQRLEVARIVLSKDPTIVERALKDNSMIGKLQAATASAINEVTMLGARATVPAVPAYVNANKR
jgi:hypothetical protein